MYRVGYCPAHSIRTSTKVKLLSMMSGLFGVVVVKIIAAFLEDYSGKAVTARFIKRASDGDICEDCGDGFLFRSVLVE